MRQKRERIRYAPTLNAFLVHEAENGHAWKADGSAGCIQTEKRRTVRTRHDEAKNDAIVDLDHFLCTDSGVWKGSPDSGVVSLHAVETRFDSVDADAFIASPYFTLEKVRMIEGVQEPVPAWGLMLQGGAEEYATTAPWIAVFPGLAIMLTVFGINLFGDSLRDVLDPKMRER